MSSAAQRHALVLQHADFEGPARVATLLERRGYVLTTRHLYRGDAVPEELPTDTLLIVMGGPMGIGDLEDPQFPFLRQELRLLERRIAEDAPVLGICLGAQLLAHAAGAQVTELLDAHGARSYELGWFDIDYTEHDADDPVLGGLPPRATVLHWHGDTFDTPSQARRLASSALCANQAFQLKQRLFGLQFHCEVTTRDVETFLARDADFVVRARGPGAVEALRSETRELGTRLQAEGDRLLENILSVMEAPELLPSSASGNVAPPT